MKILFFILGSVEKRIIAWEIEGFTSLFDQDIIFWGPIPEDSFVHRNKEIQIIKITQETTIDALLNLLPDGWSPDIITCETSTLNYVPDIYLSPVKTILFTRDAWADTIYNRGLTELFDFLGYAVIDMKMYKELHVHMLPLSNFAISVAPENVISKSYEDREIDVVAIATCNNSFYHQRYKTYYKLVEKAGINLNIKYFDGIERSEIYKYYQNSKIVLDWSHTLSNRSYEAALNGCLLFSQGDNILVNEFWTPWEEFIPYNNENLLDLLIYYINNPDHSRKIISKARQKIEQIPVTWGEMVWERIQLAYNTEVAIQKRINYASEIPISQLRYRIATPLLYNYYYGTNYPLNWEELYFNRIDEALADKEHWDMHIPPLIEAARVAFLFKRKIVAIKYLDALQKILPEYAWSYYLEARIYYEEGENDKVQIALQKAISYGLKSPELLQRYVLPAIEKGRTCDARRIADYLWESVYNHYYEYQARALLHQSFELKGYLHQRQGELQKSIDAYFEAIKYLPVPDCIYRICPLLIRYGNYDKLHEITHLGLEDSPYESIMVLYNAIALLELKRNTRAFRMLRTHKRVLKRFRGVRKVYIIRVLLSLLMIIALFGKHPGKELISRLIAILNKKAGIAYIK